MISLCILVFWFVQLIQHDLTPSIFVLHEIMIALKFISYIN